MDSRRSDLPFQPKPARGRHELRRWRKSAKLHILTPIPSPPVAGIFFLACAVAAVGRAEVETLSTDPASGIKVEVEGWTGLGTPATGRDMGLIPVTVTITNGSPADHVWTVEPDRMRSYGGQEAAAMPSARIAVPAGATGRATLFIGSLTGYAGHEMFQVSGHGVSTSFHVDRSQDNARFGTSSGLKVFAAGISKEVQAAQGNPFAKYTLSGNPLDMARAPEDWRGWSSFRRILLTEGEWQALAGGARKALQDWVATGGRAGVLVADATAGRLDGMGFPKAGPDGRRRIGAGEIVAVPWDGKALTAAEVETFLGGVRTTATELIAAYHPTSASGLSVGVIGGWDPGFNRLFDRFGVRSLPVGPILAFLAIFGLVAGPLNVMVLAGQGRRSRMFWTTPAISLVATACLLGLMFLRDGVGGAGARRVLGLIAPEQNTLAVIQEQFSRTGVLLGNSFPIAEPAWLQPLAQGDWREELRETDGRTRQGDWFRSRSDQAFLATAVRPSRARIEVVGGAENRPAKVISSIEVPLERVFVIDEDGRYWTAEDLGTGEKKPLAASDADAFDRWFKALQEDAGPVRRAALEAVKNLRGHAYATSRQAGKVAVATLGAIRWTDERADFAWPYVRSGPQ